MRREPQGTKGLIEELTFRYVPPVKSAEKDNLFRQRWRNRAFDFPYGMGRVIPALVESEKLLNR